MQIPPEVGYEYIYYMMCVDIPLVPCSLSWFAPS